MNRPASHERPYRILIRLYPAAFRERFADEMVQLFGDQLRDARAAGMPAGTARTWLRTLADLAVTATSEHTRRDRTVAHSMAEAPSIPTRALGLIGILGGVVLVLGFIPSLSWIWDFNVVRLVLFNLGAMAIGFAALRAGALGSGRVSVVVAASVILANAWYLVMLILSIGRPVYPVPDTAFRPIFFYAGAAMWLTDAVFGFVIWRVGRMARWVGLALAIGSLLAFTGMNRPVTWFWAPASMAGVAANGLAWIVLGIAVATRRRAAVTPSGEPAAKSAARR